MSSVAPIPAQCDPHFARFYDDERLLIDEVCDFADGALRTGGTAIIIAKDARLGEFNQRLKGFGANGEHAWYPGRLVILSAEETLAKILIDGWPNAARFDAVVGGLVADAVASSTPVHAFGEMVGILCESDSYDAAVELERLWNELRKSQNFSLFCGYGAALFRSERHGHALRRVCEAHDHVSPSLSLVHSIPAGELTDAVRALRQQVEVLQAELSRVRESERTLRHRERELADFVENAAEGLHRVAGDGTIMWANRAELKLLGYSYDEYIGRHISDFHVDGSVIQSILSKLICGETLQDAPARLRCKDGSFKHVLINSNAHFDAEGKLLYTRCFSRDATEQVLARQAAADAAKERERLLAELQDASQAKDQFLAMLGHELRNPLSPIVTALQLMRMRGDTGTSREQAIIQRQVEHMIRLVDDLLDISKITRGKIELKKEIFQIDDVLTKAVEIVSLLFEQRKHELTVDVQAGLQCEGDAVRVAQAVANLLSNAARYTPPGGRVALSARRVEDFIVIEVRDNGVGIAPDQQPQIFELFFQGQRSIDRAEGGLGIGLALVKSLIELHGGDVAVHSKGIGRGSAFTVRLPADLSQPDEPEIPVRIDDAKAVSQCVLVVDDNRDAAETLAIFLKAHGHSVRTANDPVAALELLREFQPDIAVLDVGLPVMDGYELAAIIRSCLGRHPCRYFALSGYGQERDRLQSEASGFEQHFVKPVVPDAILQAML
jgi:PAS domain S-box-containing protein